MRALPAQLAFFEKTGEIVERARRLTLAFGDSAVEDGGGVGDDRLPVEARRPLPARPRVTAPLIFRAKTARGRRAIFILAGRVVVPFAAGFCLERLRVVAPAARRMAVVSLASPLVTQARRSGEPPCDGFDLVVVVIFEGLVAQILRLGANRVVEPGAEAFPGPARFGAGRAPRLVVGATVFAGKSLGHVRVRQARLCGWLERRENENNPWRRLDNARESER
ncbi:hypothetical protein WOA01_22145 [Methylocystis sp. IM2]|uniref:hypothetical protein n=1 Tax=Methylocystis sp. IM2 TaxID=3136563 RepID=UPI0030FCC76D